MMIIIMMKTVKVMMIEIIDNVYYTLFLIIAQMLDHGIFYL